MERTLCIWYPDWPLRRAGVPSDEPAQAVDDGGRVVAVNAVAGAAGVRIGMRRREAEAIVPIVYTVVADVGADAARFEPVAATVEALIPRIEIAVPGLVFAPVTGAVRYFGDERALVEQVAADVVGIGGPGARFGLAAGPFAAHRAAGMATAELPVYLVEDDAAFLASLDVATLDHEELASTFRWLGIMTLGELARLPRAAVVSRFGPEGLRAHRLARGEDRDAAARTLPPDHAVEERFSPPLADLEQAAFAARALAHRLVSLLAVHGGAPHRVEIEAEAADGEIRSRTWRSQDPFDDATLAERVRWQLRAWLEGVQRAGGPGIRGGIVRLRIAPADVSDRGRQLALDEDARSRAEAQRALVQTQALVGGDEVLMAYDQGGRRPTERVGWYRWGEEAPPPQRDRDAPWPGRLPPPSPALVPPTPPVLDVEWDDGLPCRVRLGSRWVPVVSWAGPWRRAGRWWEGEAPADCYQLVTGAGAFLCEVRDGIAYMTGVYD
jgi:protein ImuB